MRLRPAPTEELDFTNDFDFGNNAQNLSTDTMELDDEADGGANVTETNDLSLAETPATPKRLGPTPQSPKFSKRSTASSPAPSHDFNTSMSFDTGSAMKAIPIPSKRDNDGDLESVRRLIARKSLASQSPVRSPRIRDDNPLPSDRKRKRDLFGSDDAGFLGASRSPFSPGVSPVSNGASSLYFTLYTAAWYVHLDTM